MGRCEDYVADSGGDCGETMKNEEWVSIIHDEIKRSFQACEKMEPVHLYET